MTAPQPRNNPALYPDTTKPQRPLGGPPIASARNLTTHELQELITAQDRTIREVEAYYTGRIAQLQAQLDRVPGWVWRWVCR